MPTRGRGAELSWGLAGVMEHQIVASRRKGGNRGKNDEWPVSRDGWWKESGKLGRKPVAVAMDLIFGAGLEGGTPPPGVFGKECGIT
jgi:hypothetical protein